MNNCIEEVLELFVLTATEKNVDLAYLIEEGVPDTIISDVTRLRQILVNLVANALKFTEAGEVVVIVDRDAHGNNQEQLHFSVCDTGIGIAAERIEDIFLSFTQGDSSTTRKYGGTGLGLSISQRLSELLGGIMWVESELGKGSTFHFTISVAPTPNDDIEPAQINFVGKRVLLIANNTLSVKMLTRQLGRWQVDTHIVAYAHAAQQGLGEVTDFDLVFIDLQSIEARREVIIALIHDVHPRLPVVLLGSIQQKNIIPEERRAAEILVKPIRPTRLHELLSNHFTTQPDSHVSAFESNPEAQAAVPLPLRILIAEDNVVNQKVALHMLRKIGYDADLCATGLEVLAALHRQPYDLILMDLQMPEMGGLEATRRIRQEWPVESQPIIVAVTAGAMEDDRQQCFAAGMDDYISKPIQFGLLTEVVRTQAARIHPRA